MTSRTVHAGVAAASDAAVSAERPDAAARILEHERPTADPPRKPGRSPALAFFAGLDMGPTAEEAQRFAAAAGGTATEVHIYPEAQHGFADPENAWGGYDPKAAADAWTRATAFLEARHRR